MEDFNVYEGIMDGLREAVAYTQGDHSNCTVSIREISVPAYKAADVIRTRQSNPQCAGLCTGRIAQNCGGVGGWRS